MDRHEAYRGRLSFRLELSSVLVKRYAEHHAASGGDLANAVLDALQTVRAANTHKAIASAEQHGVAQCGLDFTMAGLRPFGHVAKKQLAAPEAVPSLVCARAQDNR